MNKKLIVILLLIGIVMLCGTTLCLVLLPDKKPVVTTTTTTEETTTKNTTTSKPIVTRTERRTNVDVDYKPIIYIYPEKDMDVEVKLGFKDRLIVSYPKYIDSWKVLAKKDGTLIEKDTNKELYALYYESNNLYNFKVTDIGFVIKGNESAEFLEEVLPTLGLNAKESEEFIIYWLPILESNKYNYIRFATAEEINKNTPLEITPKPESLIRVLMLFKGLDKPINVKKQKLTTPVRKGYTVVEWGGTEIK